MVLWMVKCLAFFWVSSSLLRNIKDYPRGTGTISSLFYFFLLSYLLNTLMSVSENVCHLIKGKRVATLTLWSIGEMTPEK